MVPIEVVALLLWAVFGLVGLARRFPVELGATIGLTAMLFMLDLAGGRLGDVAVKVLSVLGVGVDAALLRWLAYSGVIALAVVFMYTWQTLSFPGVWPPNRLAGTLLDVIVGLFNGWLVIGTWWWITDSLAYPIAHWGWFVAPLSPRAQALLGYTPQALIPDGPSTVLIGSFLVFLLALRVFR